MRVGKDDIGITCVHLGVKLSVRISQQEDVEIAYVFLDESDLSLALGIDKRLCLVCSFNLVLVSTLQFILLRPPGCCSSLLSVHVLLLGLGV
jgi:hypothetical protein